MCARYLCLLKVQVLADGGQKSAETLKTLLVMVLQQFDDAVMHDRFGQHLQLEQLSDELNVAEGTASGLILRFL